MVVRLEHRWNGVDDLPRVLRSGVCASTQPITIRLCNVDALLLARRIEAGGGAVEPAQPAAPIVVVNGDPLLSAAAQYLLAFILTLWVVVAFNDAAKFIAGLF